MHTLTLQEMKNYLKYYVFYFILIFGVLGCGTRKVATNTSKQSSNLEQTEKTEDKTKEQGGAKSETREEEKKDVTNLETTEKTTTEFGTDGKPTKTVTEKTTRNLTDKSTKTKYVRDSLYFYINRDITKQNNITETIKIKDKSKSTEVSNTQWAWVVFGSIALIISVFFLKNKFK